MFINYEHENHVYNVTVEHGENQFFVTYDNNEYTVKATEISDPDRSGKVIVLDPGHGGHETGAINTEGVAEKTLVMKFCRLFAQKLKNRYKKRC